MGVSEPVRGICDIPMWESMKRRRLELMACTDCGTFRYPPAPICHNCLSLAAEWRPVSGKGVVLSWVVFHKQYFDDFPAPYNSIAVRLEEGPIIVTTLLVPNRTGTGSVGGSFSTMSITRGASSTRPASRGQA